MSADRGVRLLTPRPAYDETDSAGRRRSTRTGEVDVPVVLAYLRGEPVVDVRLSVEDALRVAASLVEAATVASKVRSDALADAVIAGTAEGVEPEEAVDLPAARRYIEARPRRA